MHKWDPADYEKSSSSQFLWAMQLISGLDLRGDESVLDIGCGDGRVTAEIAKRVPKGRVLGIDLSRDMIEYSMKKYPIISHPNLKFLQKDASELDFHEEFDLVVSFACLHWVRDQIPVLIGIRRSLRPAGRLLLQCGGRGNAAEILEVTQELIQEDRWSGYFKDFCFPYYFYGAEEYMLWLSSAGLKPGRVELVPKVMVKDGGTGLEGIIRNTWLPYIERLPEDLKSQFISEIAFRYIDGHPIVDGQVCVKMVRLEVEAER
jgi:trans-aconitate 2-methyltransferase